MRVTLGQKVGGVFAAVVFAMAVGTGIAAWVLMAARAQSNYVKDVVYEGVVALSTMELSVVQVEQALTDSASMRDQAGLAHGLETADRNAKVFKAATARMRELEPSDAEVFDRIDGEFDLYHEAGKKLARAHVEGGTSASSPLMAAFNDRSQALLQQLAARRERQTRAIPAALTENVESITSASIALGIACLLAILLGSILSFVVVRRLSDAVGAAAELARRIASGNLSGEALVVASDDEHGDMARALNAMQADLRSLAAQIASSSREMSASATEIAAATNEVATGTHQTAAAVNESVSTVEEVKQTAELTQRKARYVEDVSMRALEASERGQASIQQLRQSMNRVRMQMDVIAETITALGEQSEAIGEIIATVKDLAEQSNLLAVNASIEAAKAGDEGRGFAVVAKEMKSLAEQSRESTGKVRVILGVIQKATGAAVTAARQGSEVVEQSVQLTASADTAIASLTDAVSEAANASLQISASSQEQFAGMEQLAVAIEGIQQGTSQNAEAMAQIDAGVGSMNTQALGLREAASRYQL